MARGLQKRLPKVFDVLPALTDMSVKLYNSYLILNCLYIRQTNYTQSTGFRSIRDKNTH